MEITLESLNGRGGRRQLEVEKANKNPIKVSIIIPVYNSEKYLTDCLESAREQTLKDIEIICIDDGSTDDSARILAGCEALDPRIMVLHNDKNYGQSMARNRGLSHARGEYICFLDSDDMLMPEAAAELYAAACENRLDMVCFDAEDIYESDSLKRKVGEGGWKHKTGYPGVLTGPEMFSRFIQNGDMISATCLQFWKKSFLENKKIRFYEGIVHEDILFTFMGILNAERVCCMNKTYYIYRHREESTITAALSPKHLKGYFVCYYQVILFWQNHCFDQKVNQAIEKHAAKLYLRAKNIYDKLSRCGKAVPILFDNVVAESVFKLTISGVENRRGGYSHLTEEDLEKIRRFERVIIFGAGTVAREVLEIFDRNEIGVYSFAVSVRKENLRFLMGTQVLEIGELKEFGNESIVVVAVTRKYQQDIIDTLEKLGFENVILAV